MSPLKTPTFDQLDKASEVLYSWKETLDNARHLSKIIEFPKQEFESLIDPCFWPEKTTWQLIFMAIKGNQKDWLVGLNELGVDLDMRPLRVGGESAWFVIFDEDYYNKPPINFSDCIEWLLSLKDPKVNVNLPENINGQNILMYVCKNNPKMESIERLLKLGVDCGYQSDIGENALTCLESFWVNHRNLGFTSLEKIKDIMKLIVNEGHFDFSYLDSEQFIPKWKSPEFKQFTEIKEIFEAKKIKSMMDKSIPTAMNAKTKKKL